MLLLLRRKLIPKNFQIPISYHIINIFVKRHRQSYRGAGIGGLNRGTTAPSPLFGPVSEGPVTQNALSPNIALNTDAHS